MSHVQEYARDVFKKSVFTTSKQVYLGFFVLFCFFQKTFETMSSDRETPQNPRRDIKRAKGTFSDK